MQIQIAQAPDDEAQMLHWLGQRADLLCAGDPVSGSFAPVELGGESAPRQHIFFRRFLEEVKQCLRPSSLNDGVYMDKVAAADYVLSWARTGEEKDGIVVVGGSQVSRLYFKPRGEDVKAASETQRLYRAAAEYVKRTSPLCSPGPHPIFVGPSLVGLVESGDVRLVYPNGAHIPLEQNGKFKGG